MEYKRDMDRIRSLLIEIEGGRRSFATLSESMGKAILAPEEDTLPDEEATSLKYHLKLIEDAGFAEFHEYGNGLMTVEGLTWLGNEFLDNIRPEDVWNSAKEQASNLGGFSMKLLGDLVQGLVKVKIEQHTGIKLG